MAHYDWYCEDVLSGKIEVRVLWEDAQDLAFHHPNPSAEIHVGVIPTSPIESILDAEAADGKLLRSMVWAVQQAARSLRLEQAGFYVRTNVTGPGITPHMHWHLMGPGID